MYRARKEDERACYILSASRTFKFSSELLTSPVIGVPLEKVVKKFAAFYGTQRFITVFLIYRRCILSVTSHAISLTCILISLPVYVHVIQIVFPFRLPTKTLCAFLILFLRPTFPAHLIYLTFIKSTHYCTTFFVS